MNSQSYPLFLVFVVLLGSARVSGERRGGQSVIWQFCPTLPCVIYNFPATPASFCCDRGGGRYLSFQGANCFCPS